MTIHKESATALAAASVRAYHHRYDDPKIFDDPVAHMLVSAEEAEFFANGDVDTAKRHNPTLAASSSDRAVLRRAHMHLSAAPVEILTRARYCEDQLADAVSHGVRQYVLLGAGMDSFAFRRPDLNQQLQVFEIDRPAAQAFKRQRLAEVGLTPPANLHFVPVDFTQENVDVALLRSAYAPQALAFFGWMGSMPYLKRDTVLATLQAIKQVTVPGSFLVFDYLNVDAFDPAKVAPRMQEIISALRKTDPISSGFEPLALEAELAHLGFHVHENLGPSEIQARTLQGRTDGYYATEHVHFLCAVVK